MRHLNPEDITKACSQANLTITESEKMRARLRRRNTPKRNQELGEMLDMLGEEAKPLRSFIGMSVAHDFSIPLDLKLKRIMAKLGYERNQIRKMMR